ncbi:hypothetical protein OAU13_00865 [bacterium]|nr:hypothetical protein [bacterium]
MSSEVTATILYVSNTETLSNVSFAIQDTDVVTYTEMHVDTSNNVILQVEHTIKPGVQL